MRFLTHPECVAWCEAHGFPLRALPGGHLPESQPNGLELTPYYPPADSGQKVGLATLLWWLLEPQSDVLLWLGAWDVWPSSGHMPLFERLRQAFGESRPVDEAPGLLVSPSEADDGISVLLLALLFVWDCHVVSGTGTDAVFVSHDEYGWFGTRDSARLSRAVETLAAYAHPRAA